MQTTNAPKLAGGVQITKPNELPDEMFGLIWGPAGTGKTTLACTAPGNKLLINFDPDWETQR